MVNDFGNIFLSDSAFARNEHGKIGRSDRNGRFQGSIERSIVANDVVFIFESLQVL
jgi:hypothetical protein